MIIRSILILLALCLVPFSAVAQNVKDQPVYLYRSAATAQLFKPGDAAYDDSIAIWRKYLRKFRKNFQIIDRAQLLGKLKPGVMVLASTQVLDNLERAAIKDFASTGGSVLATGATGVRDGDGQTVGYDFLASMFQVRVREGAYKAGSDWFLMPFGDGPLTWPLAAGRRIFVGNDVSGILRIESDNLAGVVMNWGRAKDEVGPNGAMAFHESGNYRGVYFAFSESALGFHTPSEIAQMLDSVMAWLRHEPRLFKSAWPNAYQAAHLLEMDTEDKFFSAPSFADHLEKIGVKGTFYCLTSEAIKYPNVVKDLLARGHEIAYHADVHTGFKDETPAVQEKRIRAMKSQMQTILATSSNGVTGFRAPTESYDDTTEILLRKNGILHHAADPSAHQDRLPFFSSAEPTLAPGQALVILPRTQFDDVNFKRLGFGVARVQETLAYDLDLIVKGGAFGLLSVHTQNYIDGGLMRDSMEKYVAVVASYKDRLWVARGDQIAAWWRKRQLVSIRQSARDDNSIAMHVAVKSPGNVDGATVFVTHPSANRMPSIQALGDKPVKVQIKSLDAFRSALVFEKLDAGEYEYIVRFP